MDIEISWKFMCVENSSYDVAWPLILSNKKVLTTFPLVSVYIVDLLLILCKH